MKTTSIINTNVITGTLCAGTILLAAAGASAQQLYESEQYTGNINVFNSSGTPTTFAPATQALSGLLAFNSSGDLFVGNNNNATSITEITPNGTVSNFGFDLNQPSGVAVDSAGNVFVTETHIGQILEITPNGSSQSLFASGMVYPYGMIFHAGNLFVSDWGNGDIYEFINGVKSLYASGFQSPVGMAFNGAGDLFVANALSNNSGYVSEITPTGTKTVLSGLNVPEGMAIDNAGNLYVAVAGGAEIEELTSTGTAETFSTQVSSPIGLAFSPVPEPSTLALLAAGASAMALRLRRKK